MKGQERSPQEDNEDTNTVPWSRRPQPPTPHHASTQDFLFLKKEIEGVRQNISDIVDEVKRLGNIISNPEPPPMHPKEHPPNQQPLPIKIVHGLEDVAYNLSRLEEIRYTLVDLGQAILQQPPHIANNYLPELQPIFNNQPNINLPQLQVTNVQPEIQPIFQNEIKVSAQPPTINNQIRVKTERPHIINKVKVEPKAPQVINQINIPPQKHPKLECFFQPPQIPITNNINIEKLPTPCVTVNVDLLPFKELLEKIVLQPQSKKQNSKLSICSHTVTIFQRPMIKPQKKEVTTSVGYNQTSAPKMATHYAQTNWVMPKVQQKQKQINIIKVKNYVASPPIPQIKIPKTKVVITNHNNVSNRTFVEQTSPQIIVENKNKNVILNKNRNIVQSTPQNIKNYIELPLNKFKGDENVNSVNTHPINPAETQKCTHAEQKTKKILYIEKKQASPQPATSTLTTPQIQLALPNKTATQSGQSKKQKAQERQKAIRTFQKVLHDNSRYNRGGATKEEITMVVNDFSRMLHCSQMSLEDAWQTIRSMEEINAINRDDLWDNLGLQSEWEEDYQQQLQI